MYVTERAVFKLVEGKGLELVEVAPGTKHGIEHSPPEGVVAIALV